MKKVLLGTALAVIPSLVNAECVGLVKTSIGPDPFSYVIGSSGRADDMSLDRAKAVAAILNSRHNNHINGVEPVEAQIMDCPKSS